MITLFVNYDNLFNELIIIIYLNGRDLCFIPDDETFIQGLINKD